RPGGEEGSVLRDAGASPPAADSDYGSYGITGPATGDVADQPPGRVPYGYGQVGPGPEPAGRDARDEVPNGQNGAVNGGFVETGDVLPALGEYHPLPDSLAGEDTSRLYGQIAIY